MHWLFLVHQVQTPNSRERVKIWRLTKKVGAILYRNSVYVLPEGKEQLEDFQWLCQQIRDSLGEASVFVSDSTDEQESRTLQSLFNKARESEYNALLQEAERLLVRIQRAKEEERLSEQLMKSLSKEFANLEKILSEIEKVDFFGVALKRKAKTMIEGVKKELGAAEAPAGLARQLQHYDRKNFQGKTWATRENIHIDRLCSSWLIRKWIDPKATLVFAPESKLPKNAIPFDVFGTEFSHHGEECTFETLLRAFRIKDKALDSLAQIIHDIDMKDNKYGRTEAAGLDAVVRSLSDSLKDDHKVIEVGTVIMNSLYDRFSTRKRPK